MDVEAGRLAEGLEIAHEAPARGRRSRWKYVVGAIVMIPILGFACIGVMTTALIVYVVAALDDYPGFAPYLTDGLVEQGEEAPPFALESLDGVEVALEDYRGRPVLVSFWASWCAPCMLELEEMSLYKSALGDESLQIVAVNVRESRSNAEDAASELSPEIVYLRDIDGSVALEYGALSLPTTVLVDSEGTVAWVGTRALDADDLVRLASEGGLPSTGAYP